MGYSSPSTALPSPLISHQTGLSFTPTTAGVTGNLGSSINVPSNGKLSMTVIAHVNAGAGGIDFTLTRNSTIYYFSQGSSTALGSSGGSASTGLFGNSATNSYPITSTSPAIMSLLILTQSAGYLSGVMDYLDVLKGDVIQFRGTNNTASDIIYLDDLVVMLQ